MLDKKIFSIFLAFIPIIATYATPIPGLNVAEFILALFWIYAIFSNQVLNIKFSVPSSNLYLLYFIFYLIYSFFISGLIFGIELSGIISLCRFIFYYISAAFLGQMFFDFDEFSKWIKRVSIVAIIFLLLQYILYFVSGRVVSGFIPGLPIYLDDYANLDLAKEAEDFFFRPSSFFIEPAHMSQYLFITFIIALWSPTTSLFYKFFLGLSFFLTTSSQGIIISIIILLYYFFSTYFRGGFTSKKIVYTFLLSIIIIIIGIVLLNSQQLQYSLERLTVEGETGAVYARLGGYSVIFEDFNIINFFIGHGFGNVPDSVWLPGLAYLYYGGGLIGVFLLSLYLYHCWREGNQMIKCMVLVFVITLFEASIFMNTIIILYICFISNFSNIKNKI